MKDFLRGMYFGASITGGECGSTMMVCDDLTNDRHFTLAEVDRSGAVVTDSDGRFQRLHLEDRKEGGVQVLRRVNDNPVLKAGEKLLINVGSQVICQYILCILGKKIFTLQIIERLHV